MEDWVDPRAELDGAEIFTQSGIRSPDLPGHSNVQPSTDERTHIRLSHLEREEMAFT
jgi:hypothetical protein